MNIIINFEDVTREKRQEHNARWKQIPDHPNRILMTGGSGSGKTNALLSLINYQPDIDKFFLYLTDQYELRYRLPISKREEVGLKRLPLYTQVISMMFTKVLKSSIQKRNENP